MRVIYDFFHSCFRSGWRKKLHKTNGFFFTLFRKSFCYLAMANQQQSNHLHPIFYTCLKICSPHIDRSYYNNPLELQVLDFLFFIFSNYVKRIFHFESISDRSIRTSLNLPTIGNRGIVWKTYLKNINIF